jgi:hypothetical protein
MRLMLTLLSIFICYTVAGQNQYDYPARPYDVIPPSPDAASLGKYGQIPVSYYTGVPNINIPIYEIQNGKIALPVSLSYHSGGVKLEEISSWVGLGWSLSAGGMITRTVRGLPDEKQASGFLNNTMDYQAIINSTYSNPASSIDFYRDILQKVRSGQLDIEPDMYFFNFAGKSGKFVIDKVNKKVYTMPFQKMDIQYETELINGTNTFSRWRVKTEDGTTYVFGKSLDNTTYALEKNTNIRTDMRTSSTTSYSGWYLTEIIAPQETDILRFYYTPYMQRYCNKNSETEYTALQNSGNRTSERSTSDTRIDGVYISSISGRFGHIDFKQSANNRQDVFGSKPLEMLEIYNPDNMLIKKVGLYTSYFQTAGSLQNTYCSGWLQDERKYRLKLDSVKEIGTDGIGKPAHRFTYDYNLNAGRVLPERLSNAQDHWGFFNGKTSNTTLVPRYPFLLSNPDPNLCDNGKSYLFGADRRPNADMMKIGILTNIEYPTGGKTIFDYEGNDTYLADYPFEFTLPTDAGSNYSTYASVSTNTIIASGYTGNVATASFTINHANYRENCPFFRIFTDNPNPCQWSVQGTGGCDVRIELKYPNGSIYPLFPGELLQPLKDDGVYELKITVLNKSNPNAANISVSVQGPPTEPQVYNKAIGGLRIKQITNFDNITAANTNVQYFKYIQQTAPSKSSGFLLTDIFYHNIQGFAGGQSGTENYLIRNAQSTTPLTTTQGSPVGYREVEVTNDVNGALGKTVYQYHIESDNVAGITNYPFPPPGDLEHRRGLLLAQTDYVKTSSGFNPIHRVENEYLVVDGGFTNGLNRRIVNGVKIGCVSEFSVFYPSVNATPPTCVDPIAVPYDVISEWQYQTKTKETTYNSNDPSQFTSTITEMKYDNPGHAQLTKSIATGSKGEVITKVIKYAQDYIIAPSPTDNIAKGILLLQQKNAFVPIEQYTIKKLPNGQEFVLGGLITTFKPNQLVPDKLYGIETSQPIPLSSFTSSYINAGNALIMDARYKEKVNFASYDNLANIKEQYKSGDIHSAYIWDYNNQYPICETKNADAADIAFTSFEADGTGNFNFPNAGIYTSDAITGKKSYLMNGVNIVQKAGLNSATTYIVSYWTTNLAPFTVNGTIGSATKGMTVKGWTYYEHKLSGQSLVSISGSGLIDEVRLFPANAQMKTYTYQPLIGISSEDDANGKILYYEYDSQNRLKNIRDFNGFIVKNFCYSFAGSPSPCVLTTPVCDASNCTGAGKKCVNGVCETGVRINTSTYLNGNGLWVCIYHYLWSDNSISADYTENNLTGPCGFGD